MPIKGQPRSEYEAQGQPGFMELMEGATFVPGPAGDVTELIKFIEDPSLGRIAPLMLSILSPIKFPKSPNPKKLADALSEAQQDLSRNQGALQNAIENSNLWNRAGGKHLTDIDIRALPESEVAFIFKQANPSVTPQAAREVASYLRRSVSETDASFMKANQLRRALDTEIERSRRVGNLPWEFKTLDELTEEAMKVKK